MRLIDLFVKQSETSSDHSGIPLSPEEAWPASFEKLTGGDSFVTEEIKKCFSDTNGYFASRNEMLDRRGLKYSPEAEPWLRVIAAVEASLAKGFLRELDPRCTADEFAEALESLLLTAGIPFSLKNLRFDKQKSPFAWIELFNEYAGQSGITLYCIDLYGSSLVIGAAHIADYAEAAETAAYAGLKITSRPG